MLVINTTPLPVLTVNSGGLIETWNHGAELLFGFSIEAVRGRPFYALLGEKTSAEIETHWLFQT
ncbi:MAG: PAS domain-containing protein, partial [Anaerolineae bacterium]|nr:PAS domain-containing protein [Anaerolineae bacterium]